MKKNKRIPLQKEIWCKIRYLQQLNDISDEELSRYLAVTVRTIKNYDKDASPLTLGSLDRFLYAINLDLSQLC